MDGITVLFLLFTHFMVGACAYTEGKTGEKHKWQRWYDAEVRHGQQIKALVRDSHQ